ncbi:MAG: hypothetical protein U9R49_00745 [Bacteroidota bacterium]|nr:hypothetical protein [Bacteroidota bacterium]
MKGIALILVGCMLLLSSENLLAGFQFPVEAAEMSCCMDHSSDSCDTEADHPDGRQPCDGDHDCLPGCDCSCQYQISAITYSFIEVSGTVVHSYHYGQYVNTYSFEYSDDFLQPPRFG